jgi:hypothetical protein
MLNSIKIIFSILHSTFKTFGLFHGIRKILYTTIYKRLSDPVTADRLYAKSSYRYLEKFYKKYGAKEFSFNRPANDITENECIYWTCWLQDIESAPAIVKACVNSINKKCTRGGGGGGGVFIK